MKSEYFVYYMNEEKDLKTAGMFIDLLDAMDKAEKLSRTFPFVIVVGVPSYQVINVRSKGE